MSFLEDVVVGVSIELGSHLFTAEEIVRFASAFDPQPFHTDPEAASRSHFGGLCASGWHTAAIWMRLMTEHMRREAEASRLAGRPSARFGPSPGFEQMRWPKPVYAGETIRYRSTVAAKRPLRSRPGWGMMQTLNEGFDQEGRTVLSFLGSVMVEQRGSGG